MSNFAFLQTEWPDLYGAASKAEASAHPDARTACFHARRALEISVHWLYKHDASLKLPYQDNLSALLHEPTFKTTAGAAVFAKTVLINRLGNAAVHGHRPVQQFDALTAVRELFHVCYWLAHTYARGAKPAPGLTFDSNRLKPGLQTLGVPPSGGSARDALPRVWAKGRNIRPPKTPGRAATRPYRSPFSAWATRWPLLPPPPPTTSHLGRSRPLKTETKKLQNARCALEPLCGHI